MPAPLFKRRFKGGLGFRGIRKFRMLRGFRGFGGLEFGAKVGLGCNV